MVNSYYATSQLEVYILRSLHPIIYLQHIDPLLFNKGSDAILKAEYRL